MKVKTAGVCRPDLQLLHFGTRSTGILGHQFAGTVVEPGPAAGWFQLGHTVCSLPTVA